METSVVVFAGWPWQLLVVVVGEEKRAGVKYLGNRIGVEPTENMSIILPPI